MTTAQGACEEDRQDQGEHNHFFESAGPEGTKGFDNAHKQSADQGAGVAGQAANDRGDKAFEADQKAGVVKNGVVGPINKPDKAPIKAASKNVS
jgi:hypothetical protein